MSPRWICLALISSVIACEHSITIIVDMDSLSEDSAWDLSLDGSSVAKGEYALFSLDQLISNVCPGEYTFTMSGTITEGTQSTYQLSLDGRSEHIWSQAVDSDPLTFRVTDKEYTECFPVTVYLGFADDIDSVYWELAGESGVLSIFDHTEWSQVAYDICSDRMSLTIRKDGGFDGYIRAYVGTELVVFDRNGFTQSSHTYQFTSDTCIHQLFVDLSSILSNETALDLRYLNISIATNTSSPLLEVSELCMGQYLLLFDEQVEWNMIENVIFVDDVDIGGIVSGHSWGKSWIQFCIGDCIGSTVLSAPDGPGSIGALAVLLYIFLGVFIGSTVCWQLRFRKVKGFNELDLAELELQDELGYEQDFASHFQRVN